MQLGFTLDRTIQTPGFFSSDFARYLFFGSVLFFFLQGGFLARGAVPDRDGNGYVDAVDWASFYECLAQCGPNTGSACPCLDPFDSDGDGEVDLRDVASFQRVLGHLPIPLRDLSGEVIHVTDTERFYDGRRTCGECHDVARIENGFKFQQGRTDLDGNIIMRNDFFGDGRDWIQSAGMYGTWRPKNNRVFAAKHFSSESAVDQTSFWWTGNCSGCHPGGGGMEFDQDGKRFYNATTGMFGYEELGKTSDEVTHDVDYADLNPADGSGFGAARWDMTGVAGPDCLMCHRLDRTWTNNLDMNRAWRAGVLAAGKALVDDLGNPVPAYSAAATAGQGWFSNLVFTRFPDVFPLASKLQVDYSVGVANGSLLPDDTGALSLSPNSLAFPPTDQACLGCHLPSWGAKRGTVWFDERAVHYAGFNNLRDNNPLNDVAPERSSSCRTCHPGDLDHNFAKGKSQFNFYRDELDWVNFRTCRDCHLSELPDGTANPLKDPKAPDVPGTVQVHLLGFYNDEYGPMKVVSCQGCHIPYALDRARSVVDNSLTGTGVSYWAEAFLSADPLHPQGADKSRWYPEFRWKEDKDGVRRLFPVKFELSVYWADWNQNGTPADQSDDFIAPILLWRVRNVTGNAPLPGVTDDNGDGKKEVNRPEEILEYIQALKGNDRYGRQVSANPVLVKGRRVWYEDASSPTGVNSFEHEGSGIVVEWGEAYELHPPVLTHDKSLGYHVDSAQGCRDCHRPDTLDSPVFDRLILVDPWGPDGQPTYKKVREMTGMDPP